MKGFSQTFAIFSARLIVSEATEKTEVIRVKFGRIWIFFSKDTILLEFVIKSGKGLLNPNGKPVL